MPTPNMLRDSLLEISAIACEHHMAKRMEEYAAALAKVEEIIDQLRELYKKDPTPFGKKFLADIRHAKILARIITRADLDREAIEKERRDIVTAHEEFLQRNNLPNRGTRLGLGHRRITHCYKCKQHLDNSVDVECVACGWIVCVCGACGCGYSGTG